MRKYRKKLEYFHGYYIYISIEWLQLTAAGLCLAKWEELIGTWLKTEKLNIFNSTIAIREQIMKDY